MVKKFTGQVRAAEIQEVFDEFTSKINELVSLYNVFIS